MARPLIASFAHAGGLLWRILESGPDSPPGHPLLLLHGFAGAAEYWEPLARALPERACLIPDLPGHGGTAPPIPPEAWRMDRLAAALLEILDARGIARCDLCGYSMGGRAALHLVTHAPERVRRLVLIGASHGLSGARERRERAASDLELARAIEDHGMEAFLAYWEALPLFASQRGLPAPVRQRMREVRMRSDPPGLAAALRAFGTAFQEPLDDALPGIRTPALLVAGERDPKYREAASAMRERMPDARTETIAGAGHSVPLERPEILAAAIASFLDEDRDDEPHGGSRP